MHSIGGTVSAIRLQAKKIFRRFAKRMVYLAYKPFKLLAQRRILFRLKKKRSAKVVFQVHESAKWSCQSIYEAFRQDPMFSVMILVTPIAFFEPPLRRSTYDRTLEFFEAKKMNVAGTFDSEKQEFRKIEEFEPDIIFFQEPLDCGETPNALRCYVPYGICLTKNTTYAFDERFHFSLWRYFVETPIHKKMAEKYGTFRGDCAVVSGFAKTDVLLKPDAAPVQCPHWKTRSPQVKRIIYAPHFSIASRTSNELFSSAFSQHLRLLLDYVRSHPEIEMVFKPHPSLKRELICQNLMSSEEVERFIAAWNALPNGSVVEGGDYFDLFRTSDAMILDSISFICEYAYTGNPLLFLCRTPDILQKEFNEFGLEAAENLLYSAHSFNDIDRFIQDTVIGGNDPLKERRERFVNRVLKCTDKPAAAFILEHIKEAINGR